MGSWMQGFGKQMAGAALAWLLLSASAFAQGLATADPKGAGFSADRLARIAPWYQSRLDTSALPGTPPGVGSGIKPEPVFLKVGDVMRLGIEGLGIQTQRVVSA